MMLRRFARLSSRRVRFVASRSIQLVPRQHRQVSTSSESKHNVNINDDDDDDDDDDDEGNNKDKDKDEDNNGLPPGMARLVGDNNKDKDKDKDKDNNGLPPGMARLVAILTGSQFMNNLGFGCVIPVLPLFAADMGLGASGVGMILSTSALARVALNIPMGRAADKIGRKPLMVGGQVLTAAASIATGLCASLPALLACRLMLGCGSSAALAGSGAYMADLTTRVPTQRAKIIGFQSTIINIAYAVGPAVGGFLCDLYGPRLMFFIVGGAAMSCSAGFYMLPETFQGTKKNERDKRDEMDKKRDELDERDELDVVDKRPREDTAWQVYQPLLRDPNQQGVMMMNFAVFCSYSALMTVFPLHASEVLGEQGTAGMIGGLFASGAIVGFVGAPLGGYLADKIGRKNTIVPAGFLISLGALMTTMTTPEMGATVTTMLPAIVVWGIGNSMVNPGLSAYAADIAKDVKTRSQSLSLARMAADTAFLTAPISLGMLAQYSSCSTALFTTAGVIAAANVVFALRTTEK